MVLDSFRQVMYNIYGHLLWNVMVPSIMAVVTETVSRMFSRELKGKTICIPVGNPFSRAWGEYSTNSTDTSFDISVSHNTVLLMVHFWVHII